MIIKLNNDGTLSTYKDRVFKMSNGMNTITLFSSISKYSTILINLKLPNGTIISDNMIYSGFSLDENNNFWQYDIKQPITTIAGRIEIGLEVREVNTSKLLLTATTYMTIEESLPSDLETPTDINLFLDTANTANTKAQDALDEIARIDNENITRDLNITNLQNDVEEIGAELIAVNNSIDTINTTLDVLPQADNILTKDKATMSNNYFVDNPKSLVTKEFMQSQINVVAGVDLSGVVDADTFNSLNNETFLNLTLTEENNLINDEIKLAPHGIVSIDGNTEIVLNQTDVEKGSYIVNDTLKNEIVYENNKPKLIENVGQKTFNGSESWNQHANTNETTLLVNLPPATLVNCGVLETETNTAVSNLLPQKTSAIWSAVSTVEGFYIKDGSIYVRILKSKLSSPDVAGFKVLITNSNFIVTYKLATPSTNFIEDNIYSVVNPVIKSVSPTNEEIYKKIYGAFKSIPNTNIRDKVIDNTLYRYVDEVKTWEHLNITLAETKINTYSFLLTNFTTDFSIKNSYGFIDSIPFNNSTDDNRHWRFVGDNVSIMIYIENTIIDSYADVLIEDKFRSYLKEINATFYGERVTVEESDLYIENHDNSLMFAKGYAIQNLSDTPVKSILNLKCALYLGSQVKALNDNIKSTENNVLKNLDNTNEDLKNTRHFLKNEVTTRFQTIKKPLVTFISDDGDPDDYTLLRPIFGDAGVPMVIPMVANRIPSHLTYDQLRDLQDNYGWEIASHSLTHAHLLELTDAQVEYELAESYRLLNLNGLKCKNFCVPYGEYDNRVKGIAQKYYRGVRRSGTTIQYYDTMKNTEIIPFFSSDELATLQPLIDAVDTAKANGGWVIISFHTYAIKNSPTAIQNLKDIIAYTQSQSVDIVTLDKGLDYYANLIDIGANSEFRVTQEGKVIYKHLATKILDLNSVTANTPYSDFEVGKISYCIINSSGNATFPDLKNGVLITNRLHVATGYCYQEYKTTGSNLTYKRFVNSDGSWSSWVSNADKVVYIDKNAIDNTTPPSYFAVGTLSYNIISSAILAANRPLGASGTLFTSRLDSDYGWCFQEYTIYSTGARYIRTALDSINWNAWKQVTTV